MRTRLTFIAALLAGNSALAIGAAHAQDQSSGDGFFGIEEILVSATKRDEGLQDVPVAVTAFSQAELDLRGFGSLDGIQQAAPNLNFSVQSAGQNVARVTLRGIGTETLVGGGDPGVALHIDGVYVGRNSVAAGDIFDVERVEVLRGPQGTLFGRNATGGSINIITKKPTDELEGNADITYGNYDALRVRGTLNVPIDDNFAARITAYSDTRNGFYDNLYEQGRDPGDKNAQGGRIQLMWSGDNGAEVLVRAYYNKYGGVGPGSRYLGDDITTDNGYPAGYLVGIADTGGPVVAPAFTQGLTTRGEALLDNPTGFREIRQDTPEFLDQVIKGIDLEASFNITDTILMKSITSYQANDNLILVDADNSELPLETRRRDNQAEQFTQELNFFSQTDSPLQWLAGLYFYKEDLTELFETLVPTGVIEGSTGARQLRDASHELTSYAIFGQVSYDITEDLTLTGGLRHTWDDKTQTRNSGGNLDLISGVRFMGGGAVGGLAPSVGDVTFSEFTYKVSLDYSVTPDNLLFASYSRGYKTGGFDFNGGALVGDEQVPYNPEFVDAFEIGSKNKFFNDRALLNLTAFYYDYKDLQVFRLTGDGPLTDNAAQSTIWGLEAEAKFAATEFLNFDASLGYLSSEYDEYIVERPVLQDFSGNQLNYAPEWTAHVGAEFNQPIGEDMLTARVDWSWRSETFFDRANTELDAQEAYSIVNLRLRYDAETWFADVFGNNVLDKEFVVGQLINPPFACGCRTVNLGAPATYGVTVGLRF